MSTPAPQTPAHTKGPWVLCAHLIDGDKCPCGYRGSIWGPDEQHVICEMGSTVIAGEEGLEAPRYPRAVELANAALIAAAPALYEALQAFMAYAAQDEERYAHARRFSNQAGSECVELGAAAIAAAQRPEEGA